jgi:signal transduction histidine kinase
MRKRIFDAGFSTKAAGWGIGLSLARRIVEENHGGKLILADTDHGAVFDVILRA